MYQEDITILNVYSLNKRASKYRKARTYRPEWRIYNPRV